MRVSSSGACFVFTWKCERSAPGLTFPKRLSTRCTRLAGWSSAARPPSSDSGAVSTAAEALAVAVSAADASTSDSTCIQSITNTVRYMWAPIMTLKC